MPLYITEYESVATDRYGKGIAAPMEPAIAEQEITPGASAESSAFNEKTAFIMIHAEEAVHLKFGLSSATVTAVTTAHRMAAGETRFYGVPAGKGYCVAVVAA